MNEYEVVWCDDAAIKSDVELKKDRFADGLAAMVFAREKLAAGQRVPILACPSGEIWREDGLRAFFGIPQISK